jgi:phosphatidylglycerol:prolipoprotein diacylglycerol transferase
MFRDLQYLLQYIFKADIPDVFSYIKTFGLFVAIAFLVGGWILKKELKRKESSGLLEPELLSQAKAKKYLSKKEKEIPLERYHYVLPHQRVGEIVIIALVSGLVGAKIFNALETWGQFIQDPIGSLFSGGGLTFYGGLIFATIAIYFYCKKHTISVAHFCDAIAPALMLAYGIGRLGCHFSGDGDWGIFNSSYITNPDTSINLLFPSGFNNAVLNSSDYFVSNFGSISAVPHYYFTAPTGFPDWLFAMNFPHNVINEGVSIAGCSGNYCHVLPIPVFPTSLYEAVISILLFALLYWTRKKLKYPLHLFGLYLILNGIERFFIEKIKVNYKYDWGIIHPAQSEIIAIILLICGIFILLFHKNGRQKLNI